MIQYRSTHFKYAMIYVIVTLAVLIFLNLYSSRSSQEMFYSSKLSTMTERCYLLSTEISQLEVLNRSAAAEVLLDLENLKVNRVIVTDVYSTVIYDSSGNEAEGSYAMLPEIMKALQGYDVFSWDYQEGVMHSRMAMPIISYGTTMGCVYLMELDAQQGALLQTLQVNTLTITMILEISLILFSLAFSRVFASRVRKIMASIRIIRDGDYSHKVHLTGHDELAVLGDEFNDLADRLQESEERRRQFVSDASHELKTPLASIKLLSDSIMQNDMDIDTVREFVGDIGNEAERLNKMSHKLLSLTQAEMQTDNEFVITNIAPTVERVTRMLSALAESSKVTVESIIQKDCSILILEDDLYQIIFNLCENGIKYNRSGGTLTIALNRKDDDAVLTIQDTGVGIPEDSLQNIFERFYRVDKARSRQSGGSGLGLSIVRNMVERNNGNITVASTVGEGSVFTVNFPVFDMEDDE